MNWFTGRGSKARLARLDKLARFGSESYAAEELVAELGMHFSHRLWAYPTHRFRTTPPSLANWLQVLRNDNRAIFTASTAASAAADYILSFSNVETVEQIEELEEIPF